MNKILSIIIPTYNMENYLHKCLNSLIISNENMEKVEVLVINDGSKDSSSQIAHGYESKYAQTFRVIDKENGNYGSCVNRGLKEATGKYIKILDADDTFVNNVLDKFVTNLCKADSDLVISDFAIVNESGYISEKCIFSLPFNQTFSFAQMDDKAISWLWHHAICYKTEIVKKISYRQTEGISYTDDEWIFMPMVAVQTISYFRGVLYHYLRGRENQTFDPKVLRKTFDQRVIVAKSMIHYYNNVIGSCNVETQYYLQTKLINRIMSIYRFCLITNKCEDLVNILVRFDEFIKKESPVLYEMTDDITCGYGWKFVKGWRKAGYNNTFVINIMRLKQLLKQ